jgi:hypothetical protein
MFLFLFENHSWFTGRFWDFFEIVPTEFLEFYGLTGVESSIWCQWIERVLTLGVERWDEGEKVEQFEKRESVDLWVKFFKVRESSRERSWD